MGAIALLFIFAPIAVTFLPIAAGSTLLRVTVFIIIAVNTILILKKRFDLAICFFIVQLMFLCTETTGLISGVPYNRGGQINISIPAYGALSLLCASLALDKYLPKPSRREGNAMTIAVISLLIMFTLRFLVDREDAVSNKMIDNYAMPICVALLCVRYLEKADIPKVLRTLYICVLINALFALLDYAFGKSVVFDGYYQQNFPWYVQLVRSHRYGLPFRCCAFLGHPLINGVYFACAIAYKLNIRKTLKAIDWCEIALLLAAALTTNSRMALLVCLINFAYMILAKKKYMFLLFALPCLIILLLSVDFSSIYLALFSRDRSGSSIMARIKGLQTAMSIDVSTWFFGVGYNRSNTLLVATTGMNFEISYLIILFENGIIGSLCWLILGFTLYNGRMGKTNTPLHLKHALNGMILSFLLSNMAFNGMGDPNTLNYALWLLLALTKVSGNQYPRQLYAK